MADEEYVYTIEGNTGDIGLEVEPNGGCVNYKKHLLNNPKIAGYGRPQYPVWHENQQVLKLQNAINKDMNARLILDGIAGKETQKWMNRIVLKKGEQQYIHAIEYVQHKLNVGSKPFFDDQLEQAVKQYQRASGVLKEDGIIGYETWMRLINAYILQ